MKYYNLDLDDIYKKLNTCDDGLSTKEVLLRQKRDGLNVLKEAPRKNIFLRFLFHFKDTMIIVLIIVAVVMFIYGLLYSGDYTDTIVITIVVLFNAIMSFIQEEQAMVTLDSLKKLESDDCSVKRDNKITSIDTSNLVVGDIIYLESGDKVSADCRIISSNNLTIDESVLTGESVPVIKNNLIINKVSQLQNQTNMAFMGCSVTGGSGMGVVVNTGMNTELGKIASSINEVSDEVTPLELKINEISKKLTFLIFFIIIFVFFYSVFKGISVMETIMLCVSLAVAAIPEGLPAVITISLSAGVKSLAKKKTVVRQMSAVETLGCMDVICSDKTGTITENKMSVAGEYICDKKMVSYIACLCNDGIIDGKKYIGDPTETCLYEYIKNDIDVISFRKKHKRIIDAPFDSVRKMQSVINNVDGNDYIFVKGSIDNLLNKCGYIMDNGNINKLNKTKKDFILSKANEFTSSALRVMSFAYKKITNIPSDYDGVVALENDLVFVGMVGIIDPARPSVKKSVSECFDAGIKPIMITGDSLSTALAIAKNVGIAKSDSDGILGEELDKYSDEELVNFVKKYSVYARVNPKHKQRIVDAFQKSGLVVAMTGDGVNDAPAIKEADVGVGMGKTGTDVTKSAADIVILDDSFSTIVDASKEGRRIYSNIRSNIVYSLSSNFAEIFIVLIGMFTGVQILLPIHILFIDLITDSIPSFCLAFESGSDKLMKQKPRGINKPLFTPFIKACIFSSSVIESVFVLIIFAVTLLNSSLKVASTVALFSLVIQEIVYSISCRDLKDFVYKKGIFSNKVMNYGILLITIIELIVFVTPVGNLINITILDFSTVIWIILLNFLGFVMYEVIKPILIKYFDD